MTGQEDGCCGTSTQQPPKVSIKDPLRAILKCRDKGGAGIEQLAELFDPFKCVRAVAWRTRCDDREHYAIFLEDKPISQEDIVERCIGPNGYDPLSVKHIHGTDFIIYAYAKRRYDGVKERRGEVKIVMPF